MTEKYLYYVEYTLSFDKKLIKKFLLTCFKVRMTKTSGKTVFVKL